MLEPRAGSNYANSAEGFKPSNIGVVLNTSENNPFGRYYGAILKAEGFPNVNSLNFSTLSQHYLSTLSRVILTEGSVNQEQTTLLGYFVQNGGHLIAFKPTGKIAELAGLRNIGAEANEGYMRVNAGFAETQGVAASLLKIHGSSELYQIDDAVSLAELYSQDEALIGNPAVTTVKRGQGRISAWAFDLAKSAVYSRQGNPERKNQLRTGFDENVRIIDMLMGKKGKDWIGLDHTDTAWVEQQQKLLANLLEQPTEGGIEPLFRIYQFPDLAPSVLKVTGDVHDRIDRSDITTLVKEVEKREGHLSLYVQLPPPPASIMRRSVKRAALIFREMPAIGFLADHASFPPSDREVQKLIENGHEVGPHVELPFLTSGIEQFLDFYQNVSGLELSTARTHEIKWKGWVDTAKEYEENGIKGVFDQYHFGPRLKNAKGEWVFGHIFGGAHPMPFIDENGNLTVIKGIPTQIVDEYLMKVWPGLVGFSGKEAVQVVEKILQAAVRDGTGIAAQFHPQYLNSDYDYSQDHLDLVTGTLDLAVNLGMPIRSGADVIKFDEARDQAEIISRWNNQTGKLVVESQVTRSDLFGMVPAQFGKWQIGEIKVDNQSLDFKKRNYAGVSRAFYNLPQGQYTTLVHFFET